MVRNNSRRFHVISSLLKKPESNRKSKAGLENHDLKQSDEIAKEKISLDWYKHYFHTRFDMPPDRKF